MYVQIPQCTNFKLRVRKRDQSLEETKCKPIKRWRKRVGYLQGLKLLRRSWAITKKVSIRKTKELRCKGKNCSIEIEMAYVMCSS